MICDHKTFAAEVNVARLTSPEHSDEYFAQIQIVCEQCGALFKAVELTEVPDGVETTMIAQIKPESK